MRRLLLSSVACVALATAAPAQQSQVLVPTVPALGFTPPTVFSVIDYGAVANSPAAAAANFTAFQRTAAAACAAPGGAVIAFPAGAWYLALTAGQAALPVNCKSVSVRGSGADTTTIYPSGTGDVVAYTPPAGLLYGGGADVSGFRVYRTDNPSAGRGLLLDHAANMTVRGVHITGEYTGFECLACIKSTLLAAVADGTETQTGSTLFHIHRMVAYATAGAASIGQTTIPYSGLTGTIYFGQTVYDLTTAKAKLGTVSSWTSSTVTLASALAFNVSSSDALELADGNPAAIVLGAGTIINSSTTIAPYSYDNALLVQDVDGVFIDSVHMAFVRGSSMTVQAEHSDDNIDNIISTPDTYFDQTGANNIDFEPYGGFTTTVSGAVAPGGTSITLASAAPSNANGYFVLANGVASGVTVVGGQGTTNLVLSAGANSLGLLDGQQITLYPAFTGRVTSNSIFGIAQGAGNGTSIGGNGIVYNDPAATGDKVQLNIINPQASGVVVYAGTGLDINASILANNIRNVPSNSTMIVGGSANNIILSGQLNGTSHPPSYAVEQQGQAANVQLGALQITSSSYATRDVANTSANTNPPTMFVNGFTDLKGGAFIGHGYSTTCTGAPCASYFSIAGAAGPNPTMTAIGANANFRMASAGTGSVWAYPGTDNTAAFKVTNAAGSTNVLAVDTSGVGATVGGYLTVAGTLSTAFADLKGGAWIGATQSNYLNLGGAASGNAPSILAAGASDPNINIALNPKGTGYVNISTMERLATAYSAAGTALPTCVAGLAGSVAYVSDATAPTYRGAYTSGGAVKTLVLCDGTSWTTH